MSRAQKSRRLGAKPTPSVQQTGKGLPPSNGVQRLDGRKRPDAPTTSPVVPDDATARTIQTRS